MQRPVVSSASPSLTGLFDSDAIAYFLPDSEQDLARRILEIHDDPEAGRALATKASELFQAFRWERMSETYVNVHDQLMGTPAQTPAKVGGQA